MRSVFTDMYRIYHHFIVNDVKQKQLYQESERERGREVGTVIRNKNKNENE